MTENRTVTFRRNELLERLLAELGDDLQPAEARLIERNSSQPLAHPVVLVMGPLRSGTTLFTQWLANSGLVAYPTNLLSRFYRAPILGAKIQLLLTDPRYNFRDELGEFIRQLDFASENGKTKGVLAPNEFWYFWRRFLSEPSRDVWSDEELRRTMDVQTMLAELGGITRVFDKPFAAKAMLFNYNIPFLDSVLDKVLFVQILRDPVTNVASVLEARKRQLGSEGEWYSFKIPEYPLLADLDPITQSAGQVHYINRAVSAGMAQVDESRKLVVRYEEFCGDPRRLYNQIVEQLGIPGAAHCRGPASFSVSRSAEVPNRSQIVNAIRRFESRLVN